MGMEPVEASVEEFEAVMGETTDEDEVLDVEAVLVRGAEDPVPGDVG